MPASGPPPAPRKAVLSRPLNAATRSILRRPMWVAAVSFILAGLSVFVTLSRLEFRTSRLDLLNPNSAFNRLWLDYLAEFGENDDAVIVVQGQSRQQVRDCREEIVRRLRTHPDRFAAILARVDDSKLRSKGLHYLSLEQLERLESAVRSLAEGSQRSPASLDALNVSADHHGGWLDLETTASDGWISLALLRLSLDERQFTRAESSLTTLRDVLAQVRKERPQVSIGLTGMPVLEEDEMQASQRDSMRASVLSVAAVAILFVAGLGGARLPLLAIVTLLTSLAWSFGFLTIVVGHLNILSMAFTVILVGLGIDFAIHYIACYVHLRADGLSCESALPEVAAQVGPGVVTGALTTAIAFLMAGLTDFPGVAEMGVIAGGGIVLCLIGSLTLLPTLILLADRRFVSAPSSLPLHTCGWLVSAHPRLFAAASLALTISLAWWSPRLRYDHNLLNLQPSDKESVLVERLLLSETDQSAWCALSMADTVEQLREQRRQFLALPSVERVEDLADALPPVSDRKQRVIASISAAVVPLARRSGDPQLLNLLAMAQTEPPVVSDLPEEVACRFIGKSGVWLQRVYGRGNLWDMDVLEGFVREVKSVDPRATGHPLQTYYASKQMQRSYLVAALYALLAVSIVLMLDFRSVRMVLLAMAPVLLGGAQLFGLLGLLDLPLNPANMIVLPLLLGIGIDDGVHVVHDYRRHRNCRGRWRLSRSTAMAILLTSLTTMAGFGSFMFADHQGLRSLGRVLTLGVTCCLFTSLVLLPALLVSISAVSKPAAGCPSSTVVD